MGIRLYPITAEGIKINKFVGATDEAMISFEFMHGKYQRNEIDGETYYDNISVSDTLRKLNSFELYGWGQFIPLPSMCDVDGYVGNCGEITDPLKVRELLRSSRLNDKTKIR